MCISQFIAKIHFFKNFSPTWCDLDVYKLAIVHLEQGKSFQMIYITFYMVLV